MSFSLVELEKLKKGDRKAFNEMFRYYYPRMISYAASLVDPEVAEDIVQDVLLYIWENHEKIYVSEGFASYLFQATYTRCLDYFKKNVSSEKYQSYLYESYLEEYHRLLNQGDTIFENLSIKEFYQQLYKLLEQLPEQRRKAFILSYLEGLTAKEIANNTGIPQRTVESHIYLTLKFLKKNLSKNDFFFLTFFLHG